MEEGCPGAVAPRGGGAVRGLVAPTRADEENQNSPAHSSVGGGKLNDARFGVRMQGEGVFADHIAALFTLGCRKTGLQSRDLQLSTAAFRRPTGAQLSLFS